MCGEIQYWCRCINYPKCRYLTLEHRSFINCTLGLPVEKPFSKCGFGVDKRDEILEDNMCRVECARCEEKIRDERVANYWWNKQRP